MIARGTNNIAAIYRGDVKYARVYRGNELLWSDNPPNYQDVVLWTGDIEGSTLLDKKAGNDIDLLGSSVLVGNGSDVYIDTGIYINNYTDEIEIKGKFNSDALSFFGSNDSVNRCYVGISSGLWRLGIGSNNTTASNADLNLHVFKISRGTLYVDNVLVIDLSANANDVQSTVSFVLFALNLSTGTKYHSNFDLHYCKIKRNGITIFDTTAQAGAGSYEFDKVTGQPLLIEGTTDEVWQKSTDQYAYNLKEGFSWMELNGEIKRVPKNTDGAFIYNVGETDPEGYVCIRNVEGVTSGHNGAENGMIMSNNALVDVPTAAVFNGVDDFIQLSEEIKLSLGEKWTIEVNWNNYRINNYDCIFGSSSSVSSRMQNYVDNLELFSDNNVSLFRLSNMSNKKNNTKIVCDGGGNILVYDYANLLAQTNKNISENVTIGYLGTWRKISNRFFQGNQSYFKVTKQDSILVELTPIKSGDKRGTQTATANGMYDSVSDTIFYTEGAGELGATNGLMYDSDGNPIEFTHEQISQKSDYNDLGYLFVDRSNYPIVDPILMYAQQQQGQNLINSLNFVNGLTKIATASDGIVYAKNE